MSILERLQRLGSFGSRRKTVNFWTFIFFAAIIYDFFNDNIVSKHDILLAIAGVYGALLAIYSAEKEFRRWHKAHKSVHPGEVYSILWTILILFLIVGGIFYRVGYHIPAEVTASYVGVIGILAITRESKNFYKKRQKGK
jgi:hypothetical protein